MLRFQPKVNGNSIDSTLQSDILSTSFLKYESQWLPSTITSDYQHPSPKKDIHTGLDNLRVNK